MGDQLPSNRLLRKSLATVALEPFAEKIIGQTVWAMVSTLRGTENAVTIDVRVSFKGEAC
ncbi:MAG: hypothetical protein HYZ73_00725 [Elusimicrobia bacterium]|nr:hypothetical protein [Elusimicrobiota bacterium]